MHSVLQLQRRRVDGGHHESHPLVAFYARRAHAELLLEAAEAARTGLEGEASGELMVYADDIRSMLSFAAELHRRKAGFELLEREGRR